MPVVKWIHFSDLHLNSDGMETELMEPLFTVTICIVGIIAVLKLLLTSV